MSEPSDPSGCCLCLVPIAWSDLVYYYFLLDGYSPLQDYPLIWTTPSFEKNLLTYNCDFQLERGTMREKCPLNTKQWVTVVCDQGLNLDCLIHVPLLHTLGYHLQCMWCLLGLLGQLSGSCGTQKSNRSIGLQLLTHLKLYYLASICALLFSTTDLGGKCRGCVLPSDVEPSSLDLLLKFVYLTSQMHHSLVVHPILRKILDLPQ